jgi:predicted ArsR family transcriptional regulator
MSNFPPLRSAVLSGLLDIKRNGLDQLNDPSCPYDGPTKEALLELLAPKIVEKIVEKEVQVEAKAGRGRPSKDIRLSDEDQEMVLTEIKNTLTNLNKIGDGTGLQVNEKIQIAKTKGDQLERLLKMLERHTTVQKMEEFKEDVIKILDELVTEDDREQFMKRLEKYR